MLAIEQYGKKAWRHSFGYEVNLATSNDRDHTRWKLESSSFTNFVHTFTVMPCFQALLFPFLMWFVILMKFNVFCSSFSFMWCLESFMFFSSSAVFLSLNFFELFKFFCLKQKHTVEICLAIIAYQMLLLVYSLD